MPEIKGAHSALIEREQRGYQWIRSGVPGKNVAPPPQVKNWSITQQEQPDHPLPRVSAGKQGPNVAPPPQIKTWSVTVQEWPDHPQPYVRRGVAIPNVAAPPQVGAARTVQEWPDERQAFARPGIQGPNVAAPPQIGAAKTVQEWPDHPQPYLLRGVAIPNLVPPPVAWGGVALRGTHSALIEREQLGYQWIRSGVPGPGVAPPPPPLASIVTRQEQPDHPQPYVLRGVAISNVASPPQIGSVATRQEQPDHPGPFLWKHFTVATAVAIPRGIGLALTTQEQPYHPFGGTLIAIQGPNVGPPVKSTAITVEERPLDLQAVVRGSLFPAPITATPQGRSVTVQEQPDHPLPKTGIGIHGPNVGPPVTNIKITVQEWPDERQARVWAGIQGPNVAPPITRTAITQQEQPDHPLPRVRTGIQGPNVASGIGAIFTKQEQPDHPGPFFVGFQFPPPVIVTAKPETRIVITRQEWPDFPLNPGFTWPGTPPIFVPPPPVTAPPPGGGKRKKNRGMPPYVPPLRLMTQGDVVRAKIAAKLRKKDITEEEMRFLLSLLDDED